MPHASAAATAPRAPNVGTKTAAIASPRSNRCSGVARRWTWLAFGGASASGHTVRLQLKCPCDICSPALEPFELAALRARHTRWRREHDVHDGHVVIPRDGGANGADEHRSIVPHPGASRLPDHDHPFATVVVHAEHGSGARPQIR